MISETVRQHRRGHSCLRAQETSAAVSRKGKENTGGGGTRHSRRLSAACHPRRAPNSPCSGSSASRLSAPSSKGARRGVGADRARKDLRVLACQVQQRRRRRRWYCLRRSKPRVVVRPMRTWRSRSTRLNSHYCLVAPWRQQQQPQAQCGRSRPPRVSESPSSRASSFRTLSAAASRRSESSERARAGIEAGRRGCRSSGGSERVANWSRSLGDGGRASPRNAEPVRRTDHVRTFGQRFRTPPRDRNREHERGGAPRRGLRALR